MVIYGLENMLSVSNSDLIVQFKRILIVTVAKTLFFVLVQLCKKRNISLYKNIKLTTLYYFMIVLIPIISISAFFVNAYCLQFVPSGYNVFGGILALTIGLLIINVFIFYVFEELLKGVQAQNNAKLVHQQYELQIQHFENLEKCQENIRSIKHDINNHILCIDNYIENGLYDEAKAYIKSISEITNVHIFSNCGNIVIDSILNHIYDICLSHNICITKNIVLDGKINIDNIDLCIILSNLLQNAIEANKNIDGERKINLSIEHKKGFLIINISNSYELEPTINKGEYTTTKPDKIFHGIGLKNVKNSVEKYNGYIRFCIKDRFFEVKVLLCDK